MSRTLVLGPPGCGKSTHLAYLAFEAAQEFGPDRVLICSLTKTAAHEIRDKAQAYARERGATWRYPDSCAATLHAHARRALGNPAISHEKRNLDDWNDRHPGWTLSPTNGKTDERADGRDHGDTLFQELQVIRARGLPLPENLRLFAKRWDEWKDERDVLDFQDLIDRAKECPPPGIPAVILVDEAQDSSRAEFELLDVWGEDIHVVYVGDVDQSIFRWRGADPGWLESVSSEPDVLEQSYRIPRAVHKVACEIRAKHIHARHVAEFRPRDAEGSVWRRSASPGVVADLVESAVDEGRSVLCLAQCGYMLQPWRQALRERGVLFSGIGAPSSLLLRSFLSTETNEEAHRWVKSVDSKFLRHGTKAQFERLPRTDRFDRQNLTVAFSKGVPPPTTVEELWDVLRPEERRRIEPAYLSYLHRGVSALTESPPVLVSTITSAKGMEADLVVLSNELSTAAEMDSICNGTDALGRLFYVGVTRAREDLVIVESITGRAFRI